MNILKIIEYLYDYIRPFLDVAILAFLLYKLYEVLVKNQALQLLKGIILLLGMYTCAVALKLNTVVWLMNIIAPGIVTGVVIVFHPELRKMFFKIGKSDWAHRGNRSKYTNVDSSITAAEILSEKRRGMLVVFMRRSSLKEIIETGTRLNAEITSSLLVTIFGHDTPLHDGAVVVQGDKIVAAGCFLPLSTQTDIRKSFGTRHRAALGLSEVSDAIILIVSEESGAISLAYDSKIYYDLSNQEIQQQLELLLVSSGDMSVMEEN